MNRESLIWIVFVAAGIGLLAIGIRELTAIRREGARLARELACVIVNGLGLACFFMALMIALFQSDGPSTRSLTSRVKNDLRAMAVALETYHEDYASYPVWSADAAENVFGVKVQENPELGRQPTFRIWQAGGLATLTTPIAYITSLMTDPFAPCREVPYCYWVSSDGKGWLVWSAGRDRHYDLTLENIANAYDPNQSELSPLLVNLTYDPSNGINSQGDIWRSNRQDSPDRTTFHLFDASITFCVF